MAKWRVRVTPNFCTQCRLCEASCPFGAMREPQTSPSAPQALVRDRRRLVWMLALAPLLLAGGGALYLRDGGAAPFTAVATSTALAQENALLRADLDRALTELEMEKATRTELNRQAGELRARINELTNRLEFLAARDSRVDQPR